MASTVKPIPEGYHTVTPHLVVRDTEQALAFYQKAFGAKELGRSAGPDGKSIIHAEMQIGDSRLMLNDEFLAWGVKSPQTLNGSPVTIHLYVEDVDAVVRKAADAGAQITMPPADMFWGDRYAKVQDPFGHHWSIGCRIANLSAKEMAERAAKAFAEMGKGPQ
jgi:uncharacterized glyoxalase superfamily protein PhnB